MNEIAHRIKEKALGVGFEKCGIVKISDMAEYSDKMKKRTSEIFLGGLQYGKFMHFCKLQKLYPWAKSIIVIADSYAHYNIPDGLEAYGKAFMFDSRIDMNSPGYKKKQEFEAFLTGEGIRFENEPKFGNTGLRWAAYKAGLGIIRHNNFFYTENGSWYWLETYLTDLDAELLEENTLENCPENCGKCIKACPTGSLSKPYTMSLMQCACFITTISVELGFGRRTVKTSQKLGTCIYGCDICQEVCPHNKGKFTGGTDFPGLGEIAQYMHPETIMTLSYEELAACFISKYFYIGKKSLWLWKINALSYMANNFQEKYREAMKLGLADEDRKVRSFARKLCRLAI
jgi:epoxyqueuosine reductase